MPDLRRPVIYVARDIERALGTEPAGNYFVVSNDTPYGREIGKKYPNNVLLIQNDAILDTHELLVRKEVIDLVAKHSADILVFISTPKIERIASERGWNLLNPSAILARAVEEKVSQVKWLDSDTKFLPPHAVTVLKDVKFSGKKFVLQFNHAHTGKGTYMIESESELSALREKFEYRECRVTDFIDGPVFTVNAIVDKEVVIGNPSYQITGIHPFTDLPFSTVGNDWALPGRNGFESMRIDIETITQAIGARLRKSGWKGLFGLDFVYDQETKKTYLLEINARQAASVTFESQLEKKTAPADPSLFEIHVACLSGSHIGGNPLAKISGAQIVKRVTEKRFSVDTKSLRDKNLTVIEYENSEHNQELFRIQSDEGIMEAHAKLNALGNFIQSCIQ